MFEQQERHVIVGAAAGMPVHGRHEHVQRLVAAGCGKRRCNLIFWEEAAVGVAAFDQPVGVQ